MEESLTFQSARLLLKGLAAYHHHEVHGLSHVPRKGSALVVVNHSLATYDILLLAAAIYDQRGRHPRGLVDRRIMQTPGLAKLFRTFEAEVGTHESGKRLLEDGHLVMVSPGGMRESLRPSTRKYQIDWHDRLGFVRLAIQSQVPVVLAACPAADDIYTLYENPLTPFVYHQFKWPLPVARGLALTLLPRPVKLVHFLGKPIQPPSAKKGVSEKMVQAFHHKLVAEMKKLLAMGRGC